jgi:predicted nucleic acid-binding protein
LNLFPEQNKQKYIFDTSALIVLFEKCGLVDAFTRFAQGKELSVPLRIIEEFFAGNNDEICRSALKACFTTVNVNVADELLPYFNFDSTSGEISVISYALRNPSYTCVIDEGFGRSICDIFSVNVTGAIGIVGKMKKEGILLPNDLQDVRDKIRNSHFYLSQALCDELDRICLNHK